MMTLAELEEQLRDARIDADEAESDREKGIGMEFTCDACGKTVGSERGLKTHKGRVHRGRKPSVEKVTTPSTTNEQVKLSPEEAAIMVEALKDHPAVKLYERAKAAART